MRTVRSLGFCNTRLELPLPLTSPLIMGSDAHSLSSCRLSPPPFPRPSCPARLTGNHGPTRGGFGPCVFHVCVCVYPCPGTLASRVVWSGPCAVARSPRRRNLQSHSAAARVVACHCILFLLLFLLVRPRLLRLSSRFQHFNSSTCSATRILTAKPVQIRDYIAHAQAHLPFCP